MIYDILFRFDTQERVDEVFPVELQSFSYVTVDENGDEQTISGSQKPSSWMQGDLAILPITVTGEIPGTVTPGLWYAASGPWDMGLKDIPEFVAARNRDTGAVEHTVVVSPIDIPVIIEPTWAGLDSRFVLPATV
jgi:hypothetical protein